MYPEAIAQLRCPRHTTIPLELQPNAAYDNQGAIRNGILHCPHCHKRYPIRDGIADLLGFLAFPSSMTQLANGIPLTAWAYERHWRYRALPLLSGEPLGYERELPLITGLLDPTQPGIYLDIACSNGLYARAIANVCTNHGGHVIGIDHALPMLKQARICAQQQGLRISYIRAKAQRLPFAHHSIMGVAMGGALNEIGNADKALREVARVLTPHGRFVLMNLIAAESALGRSAQRLLKSGGVTFWSQRQLNERLAAAGFRLRAQWRYRIVLFSLLNISAPT